MAMYHCVNCDNMLDDDWHPACEHPWVRLGHKQYELDLVCPECEQVLEYEAREVQQEDNNEY